MSERPTFKKTSTAAAASAAASVAQRDSKPVFKKTTTAWGGDLKDLIISKKTDKVEPINNFSNSEHITDIVDSTTGTVIHVDRPSRFGSMAKGSVQGSGADFLNAAGTVVNTIQNPDYNRRQIQRLETALETGRTNDGKRINDTQRATIQEAISRMQQEIQQWEAQNSTSNRLYSMADELSEMSAKNIAEAKEGLGTVGQFAVDVGVAGTQMAGDALIGALLAPVTGGASALVPMAVRGFGGGTQQARQQGASLDQQLAYGLGSGALSVATERISNVAAPFRKLFGEGVADKLAGKLVSRFGENAAVQTMNRLAQTSAGRLAASALGEGSEEFIEDVFQPVLQRATYDPSAQFDLSEALYDAAVGAALGSVGGAVDIAQRRSTDAAGAAESDSVGTGTPGAETGAEGTTGFSEPTLVNRVRQSIPQIQNMGPVAEVTGTEIPQSGKLVDRLASFVNAIGNKVNRPGFGDVLFSKGRIKNSMIGHGTGPSKIETFAAVPDVIRNGQQIDYQQNWKGRGYDTYTFAAPITYRGQPTYLGVIVTKDNASNRYYLHEVVDANGDVIFRNDESPVSTPDGTSALAGDLDTVADTGDGAGTTPGAVDTVTDGRASQGVPASDTTIEPGAENVNATDPLVQILTGGRRVDQSTLSNDQFSALADRGDVGMDAGGRVYQVDPAQHIDQRGTEAISDRRVNAFQYDHPELQPYYREAAETLLRELNGSVRGGQTEGATGEYGQTYSWRTRRNTSDRIAGLLDGGMSYARIEAALDAIIHDKGRENNADAKRVETVLDDMLSNGYPGDSGFISANQDYLNAKNSIAGAAPEGESGYLAGIDENIPGAENMSSDELARALFGTPEQSYDNLGSARQGFTTSGMEGTERTSRLADSMPFNQHQEAATGLSREDYAKLFRYMSQTEGQSLARAEELVYFMQDGQRRFLRDINEEQYHELVKSLDDATAWNGPQTDAAHMIQLELQGRSANMEIPAEEYTDFLKIMREHETATGQGTQANAKWSRNDNQNGKASEMEAWDNLENSKLSKEERAQVFQRIVKWDTQIERATDPQQLKDIILDVARERGVLNNSVTNRGSRVLEAAASRSLDALTFDQLKQFAYASTSALSEDGTPTDLGQKIKTIQVLNMLSSPVTTGRNLVGNTSFYGIDALAMRGASILDMALSNVTGTRSVAGGGTSLSEAVKAMRMAIAEITMDVDMSGSESRYGTSSNRTFRASGSLPERVVSALERNQAYLLNATDEFYKGLARGTARRTQALVDQGKIRTTDKNYAQNQADALARYRTFQDNSELSAGIRVIHDVLNMAGIGDSGRTIAGHTVHSFGLGDIIAPFTRVAGNLASRGLEYSPLNAVKGTVEIARTVADAARGRTVDPAAQAKAVSDTARGLTGTAIAYGFMLLAQAGLLRQADDEDDADVAALNSSEGISGTQLNLSAAERALTGGSTAWQNGDTLVDLSSVQPLNLLMNLGTEIAKEDQNPIVTALNATGDSFMASTAELPVMQFIGNFANDVIRYGEDPKEVFFREGANTVTSSIIPNILRATARGLDDRPRNTYSGDTLAEQVAGNVRNSIPGLREELPGSVNPLGEEKTYQIEDDTARLLNTLLNPIGVNTYNQSEVSQGLEDLRERTGDVSIYPSKSAPTKVSYTDDAGNQHSKELTYEERQDYLRDRGAVAMTTLADMLGSSAYRSAGDAEKSELLDLCNDYASQRAKETILGAESTPAWVQNAKTARQDLGVSTAEYLALYNQYGSSVMSGVPYEKTKQAVAAGLTVQQYVDMKNGIDADGNGGVSQAEAQAYLDRQDYSREQKSDLWHIINKSWKKNPYA